MTGHDTQRVFKTSPSDVLKTACQCRKRKGLAYKQADAVQCAEKSSNLIQKDQPLAAIHVYAGSFKVTVQVATERDTFIQ